MTLKLPSQAMLSRLIEHYSAQTVYSPLLPHNLSTDDRGNTFWTNFIHETRLISRRSQKLEDHEINLAQKALCLLHADGRIIPAANLYVELILAGTPVPTCVLPKRALVVHQLKAPLETQRHDRNPEQPSSERQSRHTDNVGDVLEALLLVYMDAKKDFYALSSKSVDATQAARFLRDTAENLIHYKSFLQPQSQSDCLTPVNGYLQGQLLDELLETAAWSNAFVQHALGGKERIWEQSEEHRKRMKPHSVPFRKKKIRRGKGNARQCYPAQTMTDHDDNFWIDCLAPRHDPSHHHRIDQAAAQCQYHHSVSRQHSHSFGFRGRHRSMVTRLPDYYRPTRR